MMPTCGVTTEENGCHVNMVNALVWIHSLTVLLCALKHWTKLTAQYTADVFAYISAIQ